MATNSIIEKVKDTDSGNNRIAHTFYCTCSTAAGTAQKDATPADSCVFNANMLITGVTVSVKFTYSNTHATPTLKVGTATAKQIMAYGTTKSGTSATASWYAGAVVNFTYDGTYWLQNDYKVDTGEVNQNAFSNVKVGSTTIAADSKTDTLELAAGSNVTLTPDATNDKVTIAATDTDSYISAAGFDWYDTHDEVTMSLTRSGTSPTTITANIPKFNDQRGGTVPKGESVSTQSQSTKFLRSDGSWAAPSYTVNTHDYTRVCSAESTALAGYGGIQNRSLVLRCYRINDGSSSDKPSSLAYASFTTTSGTGTSKTYQTNQFYDLFAPIYYYSGTSDVAKGSYTAVGSFNDCRDSVDLRYTFNLSTPLTPGRPVYLILNVGAPSGYGGLGTLVGTATYYTQNPSSIDSNVNDSVRYKYIGIASGTYTVNLSMYNPTYRYDSVAGLCELSAYDMKELRSYVYDINSSYEYAFKETTQSISSGSGVHTGNGIAVIEDVLAGVWLVTSFCSYAGNTSGARGCGVYYTKASGAGDDDESAGTGNNEYAMVPTGTNSTCRLTCTRLITVEEDGGKFEVYAYQSSGSALNITASGLRAIRLVPFA